MSIATVVYGLLVTGCGYAEMITLEHAQACVAQSLVWLIVASRVGLIVLVNLGVCGLVYMFGKSRPPHPSPSWRRRRPP